MRYRTFNKPSQKALAKQKSHKVYRTPVQQVNDAKIMEAAQYATLIGIIGTLYDTTDLFLEEGVISPAEEARDEIKKKKKKWRLSDKHQAEINELLDIIFERLRVDADTLLHRYNVLMNSMEKGKDDWQKIEKGINRHLNISIIDDGR